MPTRQTTTHVQTTDDSNSGAQPVADQPTSQTRRMPASEDATRIEIYTDGSSIGNPGPGGYGGVLVRKDLAGTIIKEAEFWGASPLITTNIRMEMTAAIRGLQRVGSKTAEPIIVLCDCNLIPNAMNGWLSGWKAKGWRISQGKPVENRDLWEKLEAEAEGRNVTWQWVRGHNGTGLNERADALAYQAARKAERQGVSLDRRGRMLVSG